MKLIILILSSEQYPYNELEQGIRDTWLKYAHPNVSVFFYYGGDEFKVEGDKIYCPYEEKMENLGYKTIHTLDYIHKKHDYDFIFRTNLSSYVFIEKLYNYLCSLEQRKIYHGILAEYEDITFVSGSGIILSKDVVSSILENSEKWDHEFIDDVSFGKILNLLGVEPTKGKRNNVTESREIFTLEENVYHVRCKSFDGEKRKDTVLFKQIETILHNA